MPNVYNLTAKEINALLQALRIAEETEGLDDFIRKSELNNLRNKLSNTKG